MYNPLHYQSPDESSLHTAVAPAPSSNPLSWDAVIDSKNSNQAHAHLMKANDTLGRHPPTHTLSGTYIGLKNSHLPSLAPAFIPDARYQSYLLGRPKRQEQSGVNRICMARFCGYFSVVGVMFMIFVGILIDMQPMYLPGILPKHVQYTTGDRSAQVFYAVDISDRLEQASHAYRAAFLYFITACLCLGYAKNPHWVNVFKSKRQHYHDIPDNDSTLSMLHNGPSSGPHGDLLPTAAKHKDYGHRFTFIWAAIHRAGIYLSSIWPEFQARRRNRRQRFAGSKDV